MTGAVRWYRRLPGLGIASVGLVLTYNFLIAEPANRVGGPGGLGAIMLAGPLLLTVGAVLAWLPSVRPVTSGSQPRLGSIGMGLLVPVGILYIYALITGSAAASFLVSVLLVVLGVPGVALVVVDRWLRTRGQRSPRD
jgi:hypothetical protein